MKIAFIGGFKDGKKETVHYQKSGDKSVQWYLLKEDMSPKSNYLEEKLAAIIPSNRGSSHSNEAIVIYELKIITRSGDSKFFYVEPGMDKADIDKKSKKYWDLSTVIGYDFD